MDSRARFRVCSKAALFSPDLQVVLAIDLREWGMNYGLPGGHLEIGEHPDEAMQRELKEELGLSEAIALQRSDFFLHQSEDKVVLGYVGILDPAIIDTTFDSGEGRPIWLEIEAIEQRKAELGSYHDFVLASRKVLAL